ncbi:MAG: type VI secretion system Vgr family protein [Byssovorax sp.]
MPLDVTLGFPSSPDASALVASGLKVQRYELHEAVSELFELTIEVLSTDPAIGMAAIVGQPVVVDFGDEPFLKEIQGVVRRAVQRTAVSSGDSRYEWIVVPRLWLTTRRRDHRIFQDLSVTEIVAAVLADPVYNGRIPAPVTRISQPLPARRYCVQYGETDHDFICRILAEEGISSFFDHARGSAWTLVDRTSAAVDLPGSSVSFADPSNLSPALKLDPSAPRITAVVISEGVETSTYTARDYDFEKPQAGLQAASHLDAGSALPSEANLEAYEFEIGWFRADTMGADQVVRRLEALRARALTLTCDSTFALPPGTRMTLADHPRDDVNVALLVVRAHTRIIFGSVATHVLECIELSTEFRPPRRAKPRIHGTQTAFVVGPPGQEIDVDVFGRVEVQFPWDRRDLNSAGASRRVRVAQGWAGPGFGSVMLPRVGHEVIVTFLDGDPDEPIIVGRVHNAAMRTPLNLPADKTISVWRSQSSPGGNGFNQILMDDLADAERLEVHAQRDYREDVGRNSQRTVVGDEASKVGGNGGAAVGGSQSLSVGGTYSVTAGAKIAMHAPTIDLSGDVVSLTATDERLDTSTNHIVKANAIYLQGAEVVQVTGAAFHVFCNDILLDAGGAQIHLSGGDITIKAPGDITINGAMVKINC